MTKFYTKTLFLCCMILVNVMSVAYSLQLDSTVDPASKVTFQRYTVFDGNNGWEHNGITYRLACGALVVDCPNGDLLCGWLSGSAKEPSTDNCFLISRSCDKGITWSEPQIFIPAGDMAGTVTNMHRTSDGKIVVFAANWPSENEYTVWHYFKIESSDNGYTWSKPQNFMLHNDNASIGSGPMLLPDNKFLYVGCFFDKRPQPLNAPASQLALVDNEQDALSLKPADPNNKRENPGKFGSHLHGCCVFVANDDSSSNFTEYGYIANRPLGLLEPTAVQLENGKIVMLMRAEWGGYLWRSESNDNGRTWSKAFQTDIPNPTSLTCLVKLPDGRIALLHNPNGGVVGQRAKRTPLAIWISNDQMKTWYIKKNLIEGGQLAYPCGIIYNNKLIFVYDKNRREVEFVQVELD